MMNKHKDETFAYSSLKGLVEKRAKHAVEAPGELTDPPAAVSSAARKKSNRAKIRDEDGHIPDLTGVDEQSAKTQAEQPAMMPTAQAVAASVTPRKKSNKAAVRDEAGQIPALMNQIELLQDTIAALESENASLRRHLDAERKELRDLTSAMLEITQGSFRSLHAPGGKLESASEPTDTRPLTSRSIILIIAILTFIIVQVALLVYADGYFFAW